MDAYINGLDKLRGDWARRAHVPAGAPFGGVPGRTRMGLGFASPLASVEPAGDAGEGIDLPNALVGRGGDDSVTSGDAYTPIPGVLPAKGHLDYIRSFSSAGLLAIGFLLLIVVGILRPRRAFNVIVRGAQGQAGAR